LSFAWIIHRSCAHFLTRVDQTANCKGVIKGGLFFCFLQDKDGMLVMLAEQVNMEVLNAAGGELNNAVTNPFFGAL
jgi:hypothetical protein